MSLWEANFILIEEHFTFHLQYKYSGTFANRKYEELSYPKNPKICNPILVTLLKMWPHYTHSSRENVTASSGTSPLASYKEVLPPSKINVKFPWPTENGLNPPLTAILFTHIFMLLASHVNMQCIFNNYSSSPNGLWVNSAWGQRPNRLLTQRPWGREE